MTKKFSVEAGYNASLINLSTEKWYSYLSLNKVVNNETGAKFYGISMSAGNVHKLSEEIKAGNVKMDDKGYISFSVFEKKDKDKAKDPNATLPQSNAVEAPKKVLVDDDIPF